MVEVSVLIEYLENDPQKVVQRQTLEDLHLLAVKAPHLWSKGNLNAVVGFALCTPHQRLKVQALKLLIVLSNSPAVEHLVQGLLSP